MNTFNAQILTPNGSLFEGEVSGVKLPGSEGSFEVKVNHAPIVSTLDEGTVLVRKTGGDVTYIISGGFVEVNNNKLTLLAESVSES
ncbi:MAG: ATP synthase F1 subunit epsilon [Gracilimonas sp.]|nr:ATP synthase F1 subunit epsilon [Gracilimonas sp.]